MHLYLFSFQAILLAVLVINHHYIDEVEADKQYAVANWFNSMERKVDIQGTMNRVLRKIRTTADEVLNLPGRLIHPPKKVKHKKHNYEEDADLSAYVNKQELADRDPVTALDASDVTKENETEPEAQMSEVTEKQEAPKKKRKTKKHKRKHKPKPKPKPEQNEEQQDQQELQEQKIELTTEKEVAEFSRTYQRKAHKRKSRKKFVKMAPKEEIRNNSNVSDSDEIKSRKPVDIIVHIKMNE